MAWMLAEIFTLMRDGFSEFTDPLGSKTRLSSIHANQKKLSSGSIARKAVPGRYSFRVDGSYELDERAYRSDKGKSRSLLTRSGSCGTVVGFDNIVMRLLTWESIAHHIVGLDATVKQSRTRSNKS